MPHQRKLHQVTHSGEADVINLTGDLAMYSIRDEMGDFWKLLSVNSDLEGMEFISTLEAKDFPFYATQVYKLSTY